MGLRRLIIAIKMQVIWIIIYRDIERLVFGKKYSQCLNCFKKSVYNNYEYYVLGKFQLIIIKLCFVFSGFCIEVGFVLIVFLAFNVGIFISIIYCKVGSVVSVGRVRFKQNVDWKFFRNIIFVWVGTVFIVGVISVLVMYFFMFVV